MMNPKLSLLQPCCRFAIILTLALSASSCLKVPKTETPDNPDPEPLPTAEYIYPFNLEPSGYTAEITVQTDGNVALEQVVASIPPLKYNKAMLVMLTQDDCKQVAYSTTWAAINGKPLSTSYCYDAPHLRADDLPPDAYYLGTTLGSTDGAGNEVRFAFTTTLAPEWNFMNADAKVDKTNNRNFYRFYMKSGLIWDDVVELVNYGTGIAFHDVNTLAVTNVDSIAAHYAVVQDIIGEHLSGRGCKMLAEPNGNRKYVDAAQGYPPIQTITVQTDGLALRPFQVTDDLSGEPLLRNDSAELCKSEIVGQMKLPKEQRAAVHIGVHGTDAKWVDLLKWINDTYGKDGDDSVWFPSMEEYYEYNSLRQNAVIASQIRGNALVLTVTFPDNLYFYYPELTINLSALNGSHVVSVSGNNTVKGLSHGDAGNNTLMVNVNCAKYLPEHAAHFVEQYENHPTESNRDDARYFVGKLKNGVSKTDLMQRVK